MRAEDFTKAEVEKRLKFRCVHKHNGIRHPQCYRDKLGGAERVGFFDIEATNLHANFGYMLSYCILGDDSKLIKNRVTEREIKDYQFDKRLIKDLISDLKKFDRLVVYYGKDWRYDIPFVRTRAERYGLDFPGWKELYVTDVYDLAKSKLRLHRNRLQNVCELLGIESKTHPLKPEIWQKANAGERKSLEYILTHNVEDVYSLRGSFDRLKKYTQLSRSSI
jgi:uncharacterized protein YprB with RNaseH-like and TPR domain